MTQFPQIEMHAKHKTANISFSCKRYFYYSDTKALPGIALITGHLLLVKCFIVAFLSVLAHTTVTKADVCSSYGTSI